MDFLYYLFNLILQFINYIKNKGLKTMNIGKSYSNTININDTTTSILQAKIDILSAIVEGQNDIIQGRTLTLKETFDSIDKMLEKI